MGNKLYPCGTYQFLGLGGSLPYYSGFQIKVTNKTVDVNNNEII